MFDCVIFTLQIEDASTDAGFIVQDIVVKAEPTGIGELGCQRCGKILSSKTNLRRHQLGCGKTTYDFVCCKCGQKFKTSRCLKDHEKHKHGEEQKGCEKCGKTFSSDTNLRRHLKTCGVISGLKFDCGLCSKKFKTKRYLTEHVQQMHEKKYLTQCFECGKVFLHRGMFSKHKKKTGHH